MGMVGPFPQHDEVWLVTLDPTQGAEIRKLRPCLVVSPDDMNAHLSTVIVAPMTTRLRNYPTRISLRFQGKSGQVALDQVRTVDKARLVKRLGKVSETTAVAASKTLVEMFTRP